MSVVSTPADESGTSSLSPPARWIVFEKSGRSVFGQVKSVKGRLTCLVTGEKIPYRRIWLDNAPPPTGALLTKIAQQANALSIKQLWTAAADQALTLPALSALVMATGETFTGEKDNRDPIVHQLAVLELVLAHPIYFKRDEHTLMPLPADLLEKALFSQQRRLQQQLAEEAMLRMLASNQLPPTILDDRDKLLYSPDKTTSTYRALKKHVGGDGNKFVQFFLRTGALANARVHWGQLFHRTWPTASSAQNIDKLALPTLPQSTVSAFSIDDEGTIEIDDAFSVEAMDDGHWQIGIHIAAPALGIVGRSEAMARRRQLSVYFPDEKHCMLPLTCIEDCSLQVGCYQPALSLYLHYHPDSDQWSVGDTVLERIRLTTTLTPTQVDAGDMPLPIAVSYDRLKRVCATINVASPKRANEQFIDFKVSTSPLTVIRRQRSEVATVVETLMRLVNTIWGKRIADEQIGGLFRFDGSIKTAIPPSATPYMWVSSPLRRYVDLTNQRLLLSLMNQAPPLKENWRYLAYHFNQQSTQAQRFQQIMDRHWALELIAQQADGTPLVGEHMGNSRVRLFDFPLIGHWQEGPQKPLGMVSLKRVAIDFVEQHLQVTAI